MCDFTWARAVWRRARARNDGFRVPLYATHFASFTCISILHLSFSFLPIRRVCGPYELSVTNEIISRSVSLKTSVCVVVAWPCLCFCVPHANVWLVMRASREKRVFLFRSLFSCLFSWLRVLTARRNMNGKRVYARIRSTQPTTRLMCFVCGAW